MEYTNITFESKQHGVFAHASSAYVDEDYKAFNTANYGIVGSRVLYNIEAYGFKKTDKFNDINTQNIDMIMKSNGMTIVCARGFHINNIDGSVAFISNV